MLPPEALTDVTGINNCIRQCGDVQQTPAPAVLQPSAAKTCALYKVCVCDTHRFTVHLCSIALPLHMVMFTHIEPLVQL
jgi:hypothetical protein